MTSPDLTKEECFHKEQVTALVDRFERWQGYDCPYCVIDRLRDALRLTESNLRRLVAARHSDKVLMTPWLEEVRKALL